MATKFRTAGAAARLSRLQFLLLLLALLGAPMAATAQSAAPVTIFVVRHAERESSEADSPLSAAGRARAERLAVMLASAGITHTFSTEFVRTKDTVAPLAARLGLTSTVVGARDMNALIASLQGLPAGARALVAGHSNTINVIAGRLSGQEIPALDESEYDRLYVVTIAGGVGTAVLLHY
jgi:broad specificity phosphatase PhoE